jgi:hypothetical protein
MTCRSTAPKLESRRTLLMHDLQVISLKPKLKPTAPKLESRELILSI